MAIRNKTPDLTAINATHMNGIREGKVIGTARPLKIGGRLQTWSIDIESEAVVPICAARLTTAVLPNTKTGER